MLAKARAEVRQCLQANLGLGRVLCRHSTLTSTEGQGAELSQGLKHTCAAAFWVTPTAQADAAHTLPMSPPSLFHPGIRVPSQRDEPMIPRREEKGWDFLEKVV